MDLSLDPDFDHASRLIASLSKRMTRKLQAYVRTHLHVASQEILASTMAGLESLENRTRLRMQSSTMHYDDQLEQLQDQLHDLRKEICHLIKKEGAKQEFHTVQILEEVRELNKWIQEVFAKGAFSVGSPKKLFNEEVSKSDNQIQNTGGVLKQDPADNRQNGCNKKLEDCPEVVCGACAHVKNSALSLQSQNPVIKSKTTGKVLKHDPVETKQTGSNNKLEDCPEVACGPCAHVKNSVLSLQSQRTRACQMSNISGKQYGVVDQTAPVDTQGWAVKALSSCNKVNSQAVDHDIVQDLDAESKAYALNCLQCPKERRLHAKELPKPHEWEQAQCNLEDGKPMKFNLPHHSISAANSVDTEDLDSKRCTLKVFSFMENHASPHATSGKEEACDMEEFQYKGGFVMSERRIKREFKMSSKSQQFCTGNLVSGKLTGKQPWFLHSKEKRSLRQPTCHFTGRDVERLVTAIEKLGIGRWRDIKETYFSVEKHRSAANLKDKWRSLLHSAKLAPAKQRSVKLASTLVKRILDIDDEQEKLAHHKRPVASYCSGGE